MKKQQNQEKHVALQEVRAELEFPRGIHPSEMSPEEANAFWIWYYAKELEPLPTGDEDFEE